MSARARNFLTENLLHPLQGITFGMWWKLLRQNRFRVDAPYWPRALVLTATSVVNSLGARLEDAIYGRAVESARVEPPVFILGHYRSGTTFLYRLLSQDPQFAFPTVYQAYFPQTFLCTEAVVGPLAALFLTRRRVQDQLDMSVKSPADDESALGAATLLSPYIGQAFPRGQIDYDRYLTFRDVPRDEIGLWQESFREFLGKLAYRTGRPVLLKSPPHTARVGLLLETFPDARFIHIHRDPYAVFQSTRRLLEDIAPVWRLQRGHAREDKTEFIIKNYEIMYESFFRDWPRIPRGRAHEIGYEELAADPVGQVEACYEALGLSGFESFRGRLQAHLASIADHRKGSYPEVREPIRSRIARSWERCFNEWRYAT